MSKLRPITIEGEKFFYNLSFDIDDFIGDGIWWLQIYGCNKELIYDRPLSMSKIHKQKIKKIIKQEFLTYKGAIL